MAKRSKVNHPDISASPADAVQESLLSSAVPSPMPDQTISSEDAAYIDTLYAEIAEIHDELLAEAPERAEIGAESVKECDSITGDRDFHEERFNRLALT